MDLSKLTLAIFDVLAYLLPGLALLVVVALLEATFANTGMLRLDRVARAPAAALVAAYFLGQVAHGFAGWMLRGPMARLPGARGPGLRKELFDHVRQRVTEVYGIALATFDPPKLQTLEVYQLADSYLATREKTAERESLVAREGFAKTSFGAFVLAAGAMVAMGLRGGLHWRLANGSGEISLASTLLLAVVLLLVAAVFWRRYVFFHGLKMTNTYTMFLALTVREPKA